jgi:hypothetical protein
MIFGTPVDVTLSELALETFFPADDVTAERMRAMAAGLKQRRTHNTRLAKEAKKTCFFTVFAV